MKSILIILSLSVVSLVNLSPVKTKSERQTAIAVIDSCLSVESSLSNEKTETVIALTEPLPFIEDELQFEDWMTDLKKFRKR